jgi:transposase
MVLSDEKRSDIIRHLQAGKSSKEIAEWFFVSERTVRRLWSKFLATGSYKPAPLNNGRKPKMSEETMERIVLKIKEVPDMTLEEIVEEFDLNISISTLCRRLIKRGLTLKKRLSIPMNKHAQMS